MTDVRPFDPATSLVDHAGFLRSIARRLVADAATADDLVQETFVRVLRRPPQGVASLRAWLATVIRNVFRDRRLEERARLDRERESARGRAEDDRGDPFGIEVLSRALAALPKDYRRALHLRYYAQRSVAEIAAELGLPAATVKTRLHRALEMLRSDVRARAGGDAGMRALFAPLLGTPWVPAAVGATAAASAAFATKWGAVAAAMLVATAVCVPFVPDVGPASAQQALATAPSIVVADAGAHLRSEPGDPAAAVERTPVPDRRGGAPLRGSVRHEATGQPVPFCAVSLRDAEGREDLVADRDGCFRSSRAFAAEARWCVERSAAVDEWVPLAQFVRDGSLDVTTSVGPTWFVATTLPAGERPAGVLATLLPRDQHDLARVRARALSTAPLREVPGEPGIFWCRFRAEPSRSEAGCLLQLGTDDGLWYGSAAVPRLVGVAPSPIAIVLAQAGVVHGVVRDTTGAPCSGLEVTVARLGAERVDTAVACTDAQGRYRISHVLPGPASLEVNGEAIESWRRSVDVPAGRACEHDATVVTRRIGGAIEGTVTTDSGVPFTCCTVILKSRVDASIWRNAGLEWRQVDGRAVASWSFAEVPLVECDLVLETFLPCGSSPGVVRVTPPAAHVDFRIRDRLPMQAVDLRVVDGEGRAMRGWSLFLRGENGWQSRVDGDADVRTVEVPTGQPFTWRLAGAAVRTATGRVVPRDGPRTEVRVVAAPGFSAVVSALDITNYYPAAGIAVFADAVPLGATDADGDLVVDLPRAPGKLSLDTNVARVHRDADHASDLDELGGYCFSNEPARLFVYVRRL
ncbi:MAG: sigma-70 family RNA polymerase sigma factor [Planctomycetes bacterium]|nr:sigma-70 family RNA polymerase sigma factor [Planctomycetota bacterium]